MCNFQIKFRGGGYLFWEHSNQKEKERECGGNRGEEKRWEVKGRNGKERKKN